jgi:hypothetical protein
MQYISFLVVVLIAGSLAWLRRRQVGDPLDKGVRPAEVASVAGARSIRELEVRFGRI